jgi:hypothetical protein
LITHGPLETQKAVGAQNAETQLAKLLRWSHVASLHTQTKSKVVAKFVFHILTTSSPFGQKRAGG